MKSEKSNLKSAVLLPRLAVLQLITANDCFERHDQLKSIQLHREECPESVVDGRDASGIRYKISGVELVAQNRGFIEDLGSANRISVNEDCRADKGLISVSNGDQIIIGSVMMKLMVMEG